jgi:hypothetical protein
MMFSPLRWMRRSIQRRRLLCSVSAQAIGELAAEVRCLMEGMRRAGYLQSAPDGLDVYEKLKQVEALCGHQGFSSLAVRDRIDLKRFILHARDELLHAASTGRAPTSILQ